MDWQQVTQSFLPLTREQVSSFAPPHEMDLAIATYNRAIRNLNQDSADIALIALRKLASDYPQFHEASLLYGCCLAQNGQLEEARQQLLCTRQLPELPADLAEATDAALKLLDSDLAAVKAVAAAPVGLRSGPIQRPRPPRIDPVAEQLAAADLPPGSAPALLERTGRRKKVRMASERERREVMRQSDMPRQEETHVVMPRSAEETVRAVLPVAFLVLAAALVIFLGIRFLPGLFGQNGSGAQARLDYLLTELERKAPQNPELQALLTEYSNRFTPASTTAPATSTATTAAPSTIAPTTTPTTTTPSTTQAPTGVPTETTAVTQPSETAPTAAPTPTAPASTTALPTPSPTQPDTAAILLYANQFYQDGLAVKSSDIVRAAELFSQAIQLVSPMPPELTAPGVSLTAGTLRSQAQTELDAISRSAALRLRSTAQGLFDRQQYADALPLYLRAYSYHPESYGGGVAYYAGRCYQLLSQPEQARPYFQFVVQTFAGRDIATSAAARLREIGG